MLSGFQGCQLDQDVNWTITWPPTAIGRKAIQKCPGSSESNGIVSKSIEYTKTT